MDGQNGIPEGMTVVAALQPQDIQLIQAATQTQTTEAEKSPKDATPVALIKSEMSKDDSAPVEAASITIPSNYLQNTAVQEYIQRMQNQSLPLSLHQFLKFNTDVKREHITEEGVIETIVETTDMEQVFRWSLNRKIKCLISTPFCKFACRSDNLIRFKRYFQ